MYVKKTDSKYCKIIERSAKSTAGLYNTQTRINKSLPVNVSDNCNKTNIPINKKGNVHLKLES